jgi:hypothetical protein
MHIMFLIHLFIGLKLKIAGFALNSKAILHAYSMSTYSTTMVANMDVHTVKTVDESTCGKPVTINDSNPDPSVVIWLQKMSFLCGYAMGLVKYQVASSVNEKMYTFGLRMMLCGIYHVVVFKRGYNDTWQVATNGGWTTLFNAYVRNSQACETTEHDLMNLVDETIEYYPPEGMSYDEARVAVTLKIKELMKEFRAGVE